MKRREGMRGEKMRKEEKRKKEEKRRGVVSRDISGCEQNNDHASISTTELRYQ